MIKFKVVSDRAVEVHLEVRKDAGADGVLHAALAGRRTAPRWAARTSASTGAADRIDKVVTRAYDGARRPAPSCVGCTARELTRPRESLALTCTDAILMAFVLPLSAANC